MAAYFIDYININSKTNKKGRELQQYIGQFKQRLVKDDLSMDALKAEIENEIERLNKAYPRSKPIVLDFCSTDTSGQCIAFIDGKMDSVVIYLTWLMVLGTYQFGEKNEEENSPNPLHSKK